MTVNDMSSQRQIRFAELIRSLISECLLRADFYENEISIIKYKIHTPGKLHVCILHIIHGALSDFRAEFLVFTILILII